MKIEAIGKPEGCKLLRISAELTRTSEGLLVLDSIRIRGDFFFVPEEAFEGIEQSLAGLPLESVASAFDSLATESGCLCAGIHGKGIAETIRKELV
jgi:hypothetical protein